MKKNYMMALIVLVSFCSATAQREVYVRDSSFMSTGAVGVNFSLINTGDVGSSIARTPDGKIVACGQTDQSLGLEMAVCRMDTNGHLDNTFGAQHNGTKRFQIHGESIASKVLCDSNSIILCGVTNNQTELALVKLKSNGSFDSSFATHGVFAQAIGTQYEVIVNDALVLPDHKILVFGILDYTMYLQYDKMFVARFTANGHLDPTFNGTGIWIKSDSAQLYFACHLALLHNGQILCTGMNATYNSQGFFCKLNPNGHLDSTFQQNGCFLYNSASYIQCVQTPLVLPNDKIMVMETSYVHGLRLVRLLPDGNTDTTFANHGYGEITTSLGDATVGGLIRLPDGRFLVTGGVLQLYCPL